MGLEGAHPSADHRMATQGLSWLVLWAGGSCDEEWGPSRNTCQGREGTVRLGELFGPWVLLASAKVLWVDRSPLPHSCEALCLEHWTHSQFSRRQKVSQASSGGSGGFQNHRLFHGSSYIISIMPQLLM